MSKQCLTAWISAVVQSWTAVTSRLRPRTKWSARADLDRRVAVVSAVRVRGGTEGDQLPEALEPLRTARARSSLQDFGVESLERCDGMVVNALRSRGRSQMVACVVTMRRSAEPVSSIV